MAESKKRRPLTGKIALAIYVIACLALFVYIRFPFDVLKDTLEESLTRGLGRDVSLGHLRTGVPFSISVDGIRIDTVPVVDRLSVRFGIMSLFSGYWSLFMDADLPSGTGTGVLKTPVYSPGQTIDVTFDVEQVDVAVFSRLLPSEYQPKGTITGSAAIQSSTESFERATGDVMFFWTQGGMPISIPAFPLSEIPFERLDVQARLDRGVLTLEKADMTGDISGSVKGALQLARDIRRSRMNLSGEVILPDSIKNLLGMRRASAGGPVRFSLRGSLDRPQFRVLSR
ncbi:MAG: type II secretion system protein GspN [Desulfomonilia bacterium]